MKVNLKNPSTGEVKQCKVGFSWTMLFFGFFVPLLRGDWKWLVIMLLINACTIGIAQLVMAFLYNKFYLKDLVERGFEPASDTDHTILQQHGIVFN